MPVFFGAPSASISFAGLSIEKKGDTIIVVEISKRSLAICRRTQFIFIYIYINLSMV